LIDFPHAKLGIAQQGHPQKYLLSDIPCPLVTYPSPLSTTASSITHCSIVWQRNSWCSQNMLLIDLALHTAQWSGSIIGGALKRCWSLVGWYKAATRVM